MRDHQIIELYHNRDEQAIAETEKAYGTYCHRIALNILSVHEDAEECVNDTYLAAWKRMPPAFPNCLRIFLGKITRNLSISLYRANHAKKRFSGAEILLSELEDCIPSPNNIEEIIEGKQLSVLISNWLDTLPEMDCALFVRRYWHGDSISSLAKEYGCLPTQMTQRMLRLRRKLKTFLEKEGVTI